MIKVSVDEEFGVLMTVNVNTLVFWDVIQCTRVHKYPTFKRILLPQSLGSTPLTEAAGFSEMWLPAYQTTVIPRLTKIIRSGITFVSRNMFLTSRCLERKQPSRVGGSPLCDAVSSFLCHTHTDGKDKLLEWPDRSCLLLYVSARIH